MDPVIKVTWGSRSTMVDVIVHRASYRALTKLCLEF